METYSYDSIAYSQSCIRTADNTADWCIFLLYYRIPQKTTTRKDAQSFFFMWVNHNCASDISVKQNKTVKKSSEVHTLSHAPV